MLKYQELFLFPSNDVIFEKWCNIYVNNLPDGLSSNCKLFADDTSLFSVVHDATISSSELNSDLANISEWAFKWKMNFNPDQSKPAQDVIFSWKLKTVPHLSITFNNNPCPD